MAGVVGGGGGFRCDKLPFVARHVVGTTGGAVPFSGPKGAVGARFALVAPRLPQLARPVDVLKRFTVFFDVFV